MGDLFAKVLVAADSRRNPAAGMFYRAASDLGGLIGKIGSSLCSSGESPSPQIYPSCQSHSAVPAQRPLYYSTMRHRDVPDFTRCISAAVARLREQYGAQQKAVSATRMEIDSHERIDLRQLGREIKELQGEIDRCRTSESALVRQRGAYRAEGVLRNVFVHGFSQLSLLCQVRELRKGESSLAARQAALKELVDKRNSFDFSAKKRLLETQEGELNAIWQRWLSQWERLDYFNRQMKSFIDPIVDTARRLNCLIDRYNALSRYEAELNAARNAYERRLVHKKCEAAFGDGSVGRLLGRVVPQIRGVSSLYDMQVRQAEGHAHAIGLQVQG